ncbi:MAG: hypothetical protein R2762_23690 [Bryobacteraceae bacterium]
MNQVSDSPLAAASPAWQEHLRTFHLTGHGLEDPNPQPLRPAVVDALMAAGNFKSEFPAFVSAGSALASLAELLGDNGEPVLDALREVAMDPAGTAIDAIPGSSTMPPEAIVRARATLSKGMLFPCDARSLPRMYGSVLHAARRTVRAEWLARVKDRADRLRTLLAAGATSGSTDPRTNLESAFGVEGGRLLDAGKLTQALGHLRGAPRIGGERRARLESALAALDKATREASAEPAAWAFYSGSPPPGADPLGWECRPTGDSFAAALEFVRHLLDRMTPVWRATRLAGIELESAYDDVVHGERLARFTWHSAEPEELLALPPVIVVETADRVAEGSLTAFGRLLRSGYPVQILVASPAIAPDLPELGYLATAHRQPFVLSASLALLGHLAHGLAQMAVSVRPSVAVVAVPAPGEGWREATAAAIARTHPIYVFDPEKGEHWRTRLSLSGDEDGANPWIGVETRPGSTERFTPAHAAAVSMSMRRHFRLIPADAPDGSLMELGEYLDRFEKEPPLAVPFLWVLDEHRQLRRAAITRELAEYCADRKDLLRGLRELAGREGSPAVPAVDACADQPARHHECDQAAIAAARQSAAAATINRLVQVLLGSTPATLKAPPSGASLPSPRAATPPPLAVSPGPEPASQLPYIESSLCTSCNDCCRINSRMFQYDANNQAYIADASAGTFAELVKAAEKCPARCIHPGAPRPDDSSATAAMLARGAKFD